MEAAKVLLIIHRPYEGPRRISMITHVYLVALAAIIHPQCAVNKFNSVGKRTASPGRRHVNTMAATCTAAAVKHLPLT